MGGKEKKTEWEEADTTEDMEKNQIELDGIQMDRFANQNICKHQETHKYSTLGFSYNDYLLLE